MAFEGSTPPFKKRRLIPLQSITDTSVTPSPPITPRANNINSMNFQSPLINNKMPHVNSTPIKNYFAKFTENTNHENKIKKTIKAITPRTLWKNSDKIIPFPPSSKKQESNNNMIIIDNNKFNDFYNPSIDLNECSNYFDDEPFLDPTLQIKLRDNAFKILCHIKDEEKEEKIIDIDLNDNDECIIDIDDNDSYNNMKIGILFLSGVLQHIISIILDNAGYLAQCNNNMMQINDKNMFIIHPLHIRHCIHDDNELFWLQQTIQTTNCAINHIEIINELNKDCVYHICSFFCGDLPMLSSLARVNTTFYAMTSSNNLWKPIAMRCFLFNPSIIQQIEDNQDNDDDFRSYISLSQHIKLTVLRERWIKQDRYSNDELFQLFVRINPVYTDLHRNLYKLLYHNHNHQDIDLFIDNEIYDLFHQILQIFGTRNDFITISQIINNIKCLNYHQIQQRLSNVFTINLSKYQENDLNKVIQIEYNNNDNDDEDILFIQIPLSQNCVENNNKNLDIDYNKHYLWMGQNIVIFAQVK